MNAIIKQAQVIAAALAQLAPTATFGGFTLDTFDALISAGTDAEATVSQRAADLQDARVARDQAVAALQEAASKVVNGVKGDIDYGPDSALYGAMGFVRDSERRSGLSRGKTPTPPPTP